MFVKLIGYADTHGGRLPVPVNVVADEFINIGTIPDFEKKISTARSRNVNIIMIYQELICKGWFLPPNTYMTAAHLW